MLTRLFVLCGLLLSSSLLSFGQLCFPVKKGFAYAQPVNRGTASREDRREARQSVNHLVYIQSKSEGVTVKNVWVNGELHAAELKEVKTPVTMSSPLNKSEAVVLVPASSRKTYQLLFIPLSRNDVTPAVPAKFQNTPVLIELQYKKKKKYLPIRDLKQLDIMPLY
jgi:hypothetical protein